METGLLQETTLKKKHGQCEKAILPVRDALDVLSGKWKLQIILALTFGNLRFKEIQRRINRITAKMLSKELKDLELNQLLKRTVYDTVPVTVEYALTPYGRTLKKVIVALGSWGTKHRERIMGKGK
jgi:DNA-binding HxlR family transcriptional regulator